MKDRPTLVIPAAGLGSRFLQTPGSSPKCMVRIHGRPLLEHVLETGLLSPVSQIVIVISPTGGAVRSYFGTSWRGVRIHYVTQEIPRGLADAVAHAQPFVGQQMLVINGDEIHVGGRCGEICRYAIDRGADGIVGYLRTAWGDPRIRQAYGLDLGPDGRVLRLVEKPIPAWNDLLGVGLWLLGSDYFGCFSRTPASKQRGERDFVEVIQRMMAEGRAIYGMNLESEFVNVNTQADLVAAEDALGSSIPEAQVRTLTPVLAHHE